MVRILEEENGRFQGPVLEAVARETESPFHVLVSCILSLRTKDETTDRASGRLYALASNVREMARLSVEDVEKAIFPVGFYRVKARTILELCRDLIERFGGEVPSDIDALLTLKGVGRKTANLVVTLGFDRDGICVDTHVHRICNRWGYVRTKSPDETERALRAKLPRKYWKRINQLLVTYGQNVCKPISPLCSGCRIAEWCRRVGVERFR